jgi:hypothetical protein
MAAASVADVVARRIFFWRIGVRHYLTFAAIGSALLMAVPAEAASHKKYSKSAAHVQRYQSAVRDPKAENGYNGYYERVLERVPFGSQLWWRVYHSYPRGG